MLKKIVELAKSQNDNMDWNEYFMSIAIVSSLRSKDPSKKVGCCIVDNTTKRIISIGYNGFPRGCNDSQLSWAKDGDWLDQKYPYVVHAEANAIVNANKAMSNSTLYVTLFPCNECAKLMIQAGIKHFFYLNDTNTLAKKAAVKMFQLANVTFDKIDT